LRDAGMKKINFAGGEPFLKPKFLGELVKYCKEVSASSSTISKSNILHV
jgi:radical S-adenosyl methionine domain-containing protein 2